MAQRVRSRPAGAATVLLVAGIVLIALNLRPAVTTVGPLTDDIRSGLGLSNTATGLLTTLPILAFGLLAFAVTPLALRLGIERVLGIGVALIAAGILVRSAGSIPAAFIGTTIAGAGIAAGNVLLPSLVKEEFPDRSGPMTSLYVTAMVGTAGPRVRHQRAARRRRRPGLAEGARLLGAAGGDRLRRVDTPDAAPARAPGRAVGRADAVAVAARLADHALHGPPVDDLLRGASPGFPDLLLSEGLSESTGGLMVGLLQVGGLIGDDRHAGARGAPAHSGRPCDVSTWSAWRRWPGLLIAPADLAALWAILLGLCTGCYLSLALTFLVMRAPDTAHTSRPCPAWRRPAATRSRPSARPASAPFMTCPATGPCRCGR